MTSVFKKAHTGMGSWNKGDKNQTSKLHHLHYNLHMAFKEFQLMNFSRTSRGHVLLIAVIWRNKGRIFKDISKIIQWWIQGTDSRHSHSYFHMVSADYGGSNFRHNCSRNLSDDTWYNFLMNISELPSPNMLVPPSLPISSFSSFFFVID